MTDKEQIIFTNAMSNNIFMFKEGRTYYNNPSEAPKGVALKRGPRGGYYTDAPVGKGKEDSIDNKNYKLDMQHKALAAKRLKITDAIKQKATGWDEFHKMVADNSEIKQIDKKLDSIAKQRTEPSSKAEPSSPAKIGKKVTLTDGRKGTIKSTDGKFTNVEFDDGTTLTVGGGYAVDIAKEPSAPTEEKPEDRHVAEIITDASIMILTDANSTSGADMKKPELKQDFLDRLKAKGITKVPKGVINILENENFHTEVEILEEAGMVEDDKYENEDADLYGVHPHPAPGPPKEDTREFNAGDIVEEPKQKNEPNQKSGTKQKNFETRSKDLEKFVRELIDKIDEQQTNTDYKNQGRGMDALYKRLGDIVGND